MKRIWLWLPLAIVVVVLVIFAVGLIQPDDRQIRSGLVGKPLPVLKLPAPFAGDPPLDTSIVANGKPRLVNIFASWCIPCITEVPVLLQLEQNGVDIIGVAVRERPEALAVFLAEHGNPYSQIGYDPTSRIQLLFGSTGVPETFVIDGKGQITYQHIGAVSRDDIPLMLAKLDEAK